MAISRTSGRTILALAALAVTAAGVRAEEGMWTYHGVPTQRIQSAYGFAPSQQWLDHLRLSSVRLNDGGSGAFVSADGLLITNHHVAMGQLQKASDKDKKDYVKEGFYAKGREQEFKTNDLEINVLISMENVTERVRGAVKPGATDEEANKQRKAEMAAIEKQSQEATGLRSDVVELYQGGEYWLYRYKKFTDVRLVMAPEQQAAFFGGDPDNFTYPRHDLDMAFFRVYEDGKPYKPENFLKWSEGGAKDGELVFVSGHPGRTQRLKTIAQLEYLKDVRAPEIFDGLKRVQKTLEDYSAEGAEQARQAKAELFSINNSLKVYEGKLQALRDPAVWGRKVAEEKELRAAVEKDAEMSRAYGKAWGQIEEVTRQAAKTFQERAYRSFGGLLGGGELAGIADTIVKYVREIVKPNGDRWKEFRDSGLESLHQNLYSDAPIHVDMEKKLLANSLRMSLEKLGAQDPFIQEALGGKTPEEVASEVVSNTKLLDVEYRKKLIEGGQKAVDESDDPLIRLAAKLLPYYAESRTWQEKVVESVEVLAGALIAKARFAYYGNTQYPDATFTLRLSYGKVAGYEQGTTSVAPVTTYYGLFDRAAGMGYKPPFDLPAKVVAAREKVKLETPLNFVTTNDIIGGNSGSPVVNEKGEYVGLIFDGNIQSLAGDFVFDERQNRAVAVHSAGILEALTSIYGMHELAAELTQKATGGSSDDNGKSSGK